MNVYHDNARRIQHYLESLFAGEDCTLEKIRMEIEKHGLPQISITPLIGKILYLLTKLTGARRILEIGTLGGYSAIWMARALGVKGKLISLEINPDFAVLAENHIKEAGLKDKVEIIIGPALLTLEKMIEKGEDLFDLIFLDADKTNYPQYIEPLVSLTRPGGIILADNLIRRGKVIAPPPNDPQANALSEFNRRIASDPRLESVIFPMLVGYLGGDLDGLSISRVLGVE